MAGVLSLCRPVSPTLHYNLKNSKSLVGASLSEPHINGVLSRNYCIMMVRRTYVVRTSL